MQLTVKGNHLDVGDSLREYVSTNLSQTTEKYFTDPIEATVIFTKGKGHRYRVDISVHVAKGIIVQAHHEAEDPYPAFDTASGRMASRLRKYKDKLRDHHKDESTESLSAAYATFQSNENEEESEGTSEPVVVAEMETQIPTLAVSDAVMRLELADLPILMFKNPSHGELNVVYRRKDGNIGWIDPAAKK